MATSLATAALVGLPAGSVAARGPFGLRHDPGTQTTDTTTAGTTQVPADSGGHHKGGGDTTSAPPTAPPVSPVSPAPVQASPPAALTRVTPSRRRHPAARARARRRPAGARRRPSGARRSARRRRAGPGAPVVPRLPIVGPPLIGPPVVGPPVLTQASVRRAPSGRRRARTRAPGGPEHRPRDTVSQPLAPAILQRIEHVTPAAVRWLIAAAAGALLLAAGIAAVIARRSRRQSEALASAHAAATTDPLTGVLNRRGFLDAMNRELDRARRHHHSFAIAYLDVRNFKQVNDAHGHDAGDRLLVGVARLLTGTARHHDLVGRLGGDELALLLVEQTASGSVAVLDRVRSGVEQLRGELGLTTAWDLTVGIAEFPADGQEVAELMKVADRRLYEQRGIVLR